MRIGQKIKEEKIGILSHNAGIISLAISTINIGGIQVDTDPLSRTISSDVTMTANTLYMVYVAMLTGAPVMRISANVNSTGPSGFASWKLVGAFYSNGVTGSIAFGSFVNIDGPQKTNNIPYLPSFVNLGTVTGVDIRWSRDASILRIEGRFTSGTVSAGSATISLPDSFIGSPTNAFICGDYGTQGTTTGSATVYNNATNVLFFGMANWGVAATGSQVATGGFNSFNASIPITGWDNTQIRDL